VPALAAFATFQFLWVWNDLLIALLTMAVPVLVFVSLQRYFVRGLTAGTAGG
jgi:alpha-glucoside transport system permease protein